MYETVARSQEQLFWKLLNTLIKTILPVLLLLKHYLFHYLELTRADIY